MDTQSYDEKGLGAVRNLEDNRDIHIASVVETIAHPPINITDISFLPVEDQQDKGTCVGQGEGKGEEYRETKEKGGIFTRLSKRFIYTQCKLRDGSAQQGTQPRIAAKVLTESGTPREILVPDNNSLPYDQYLAVIVNNDILTDASSTRVKGYVFCYTLDDIKTAIDHAGIMHITMEVGNWNSLPVKAAPYRGDHRIMLFGYEDALNNGVPDTKIYFRNSWGAAWGDNGNGWFWWSQYSVHVSDMMVYTDMPDTVIDYAKSQQYKFTRELQVGSRGVDVTELQKRLTKEIAQDGHPCYLYGSYTAYFGLNTQQAVQRYQVVKGIAAPGTLGYGRVGPKTLMSLNAGVVEKKTLIEALIQVESNGNDNAHGDIGYINPKTGALEEAFGPLQIRQPVCTDVNKSLGTSYRPQDCLGNRSLSITIFNAYQALYATPTHIGGPVTDEDRARIWNGGPNGWKNASTEGYWTKVKTILQS